MAISTEQFDPNSATTQIATTVNSYKKVASFLATTLEPETVVLDYGAGLGMGAAAMRDILEPSGVHVFSYEPFPERGAEAPDFSNPNSIDIKFDAIVNLNVLNVVPKNIRDQLVTHIISLLKPEGIAVIGTRGWNGDVNGAKNFEEGPEPKSLIILRAKKGETIRVFQKGFDGPELQSYIQSFTKRKVDNLRNKFAASSVIVGPTSSL
jgi:SAM-dependent methyltransferase